MNILALFLLCTTQAVVFIGTASPVRITNHLDLHTESQESTEYDYRTYLFDIDGFEPPPTPGISFSIR